MRIRDIFDVTINWLCDNAKFVAAFFTVLLGVFQIKVIEDYFTQRSFLFIDNSYYFLIILFILLSLLFIYIEQQELKIIKNKSLADKKLIDDLGEKNNVLSSQISLLENSSEMIYNSYSELFESFLRLLFNSLSLNYEDRISVYKVISINGNECFELIGRVSDNPNLEKAGRKTYPVNEGFISIGWERGEYSVESLPCPSGFEEYLTAVKEYKDISADIITNLNMKSRNYYIHRLKINDKPNCILVFESLAPKKLNEAVIKTSLNDVGNQLKDFVNKRISKDISSLPNTATDSGF
jgi:hypothetical protein